MAPVHIYFKEVLLNYDNWLTLDFASDIYVNQILFFSKYDYYITTFNCDLKLLKDVNAQNDILGDLKKLSDSSRKLLWKGCWISKWYKKMRL